MTAKDAVAKALASGKYKQIATGDRAPIHDFTENEVLEGVYQGMRTVEIKGKDRTIHDFETADGPVAAWGCYALDHDLPGREGQQILVAFLGMVTTKSGNTAKSFQILGGDIESDDDF